MSNNLFYFQYLKKICILSSKNVYVSVIYTFIYLLYTMMTVLQGLLLDISILKKISKNKRFSCRVDFRVIL